MGADAFYEINFQLNFSLWNTLIVKQSINGKISAIEMNVAHQINLVLCVQLNHRKNPTRKKKIQFTHHIFMTLAIRFVFSEFVKFMWNEKTCWIFLSAQNSSENKNFYKEKKKRFNLTFYLLSHVFVNRSSEFKVLFKVSPQIDMWGYIFSYMKRMFNNARLHHVRLYFIKIVSTHCHDYLLQKTEVLRNFTISGDVASQLAIWISILHKLLYIMLAGYSVSLFKCRQTFRSKDGIWKSQFRWDQMHVVIQFDWIDWH